MQNSLPRSAKVLSIILYSDMTTCNNLGKTSKYPIYLTLGNIISWHRNKPDAKILLGYLSQLKVKTISEKKIQKLLFGKMYNLSIFFGYINKTVA